MNRIKKLLQGPCDSFFQSFTSRPGLLPLIVLIGWMGALEESSEGSPDSPRAVVCSLTMSDGSQVVIHEPVFVVARKAPASSFARKPVTPQPGHHVMVDLGRYIAAVPLPLIETMKLTSEYVAGGKQQVVQATVRLVSGIELTGRLWKMGLISGDVSGRPVELELTEVRSLKLLEGMNPAHQDPGGGSRTVVLKLGPDAKLRITDAGFAKLRGPGVAGPFLSRTSETIRLKTGETISWDEIKSISPVISSIRGHDHVFTLRTGKSVSLEPDASQAVMGLAEIGSAKIPVILPFSRSFDLEF